MQISRNSTMITTPREKTTEDTILNRSEPEENTSADDNYQMS